MIWNSNVLRFKRIGCELMCDSNNFGCQVDVTSSDLDFECFPRHVAPC